MNFRAESQPKRHELSPDARVSAWPIPGGLLQHEYSVPLAV
jgi:hypothetical protein